MLAPMRQMPAPPADDLWPYQALDLGHIEAALDRGEHIRSTFLRPVPAKLA